MFFPDDREHILDLTFLTAMAPIQHRIEMHLEFRRDFTNCIHTGGLGFRRGLTGAPLTLGEIHAHCLKLSADISALAKDPTHKVPASPILYLSLLIDS